MHHVSSRSTTDTAFFVRQNRKWFGEIIVIQVSSRWDLKIAEYPQVRMYLSMVCRKRDKLKQFQFVKCGLTSKIYQIKQVITYVIISKNILHSDTKCAHKYQLNAIKLQNAPFSAHAMRQFNHHEESDENFISLKKTHVLWQFYSD